MTDQKTHYTAAVYVALPGTPLNVSGGTSAAGHMYYVISDGKNKYSYGFAPAEHGSSSGPGKVYDTDLKDYQNPRYARTMEITREQYEKMRAFGDDPAKHGFDLTYGGARNSCIDFTWGALNKAGLHRKSPLGFGDKSYEGELKPQENIDIIKRIEAPLPDSGLNSEHYNPKPERTFWQKVISDNQQPGPTPSMAQEASEYASNSAPQRDPLITQAEQAVRRMELGLGREYDDSSKCLAASAACMAKENGLSRIDHIVLSRGAGQARQGENFFVVQGDLNDPTHLRAHGSTVAALQTPVEASMQRYEQMAQTKSHEDARQQDQMQQEQRSVPRMG